jgi:DNA-binding XRE family transcriptional regulator
MEVNSMAINDAELRAEMGRKKVSQTELARRTNRSKNTINNICNGKTTCSLELANEICDALNIESGDRRAEIFLA